MHLVEIETGKLWLVAALALFQLAALAFVISRGKRRRMRGQNGANPSSAKAPSRCDPKAVSREIERLCAGETPNDALIRDMSAEERALFEVSIIDALNSAAREGQDMLRSALIKHGYDEQCSRRVMSQDLSDRVRATALLSLLRPQWRNPTLDSSEERLARARAASVETGSLEPDE